MIAIKHVLVPTDFSDASTTALNYGREMARTYSATLHLLNAPDDLTWRYSMDMSPILFDGVQKEIEESAKERLEALLNDEDRQQLHARAVVQTSLATAATIVDYAKTNGIDLIVLGTHGRGGVSHLLLGSVAERVVRLAPCPVLTVRPEAKDVIVPDALTVTTRNS